MRVQKEQLKDIENRLYEVSCEIARLLEMVDEALESESIQVEVLNQQNLKEIF